MKHETLNLATSGNQDKRRELDFYPTPPECTIALMDFLKLGPSRIWEPACGDMAMSRVLISHGHTVYSTDINIGINYLLTKPNGVFDAIITNPPFNKSMNFIQKAIKESRIVAMLLKSQYWHSRSRYSFYVHNPPAYVLPLTWRPDFMGGESGGSPTMEVAWTVWIEGNTGMKYLPLPKPKIDTGQLSIF